MRERTRKLRVRGSGTYVRGNVDVEHDHAYITASKPFVESPFRGSPRFAWEWLAALKQMYPGVLCMPRACRPRSHAMIVHRSESTASIDGVHEGVGDDGDNGDVGHDTNGVYSRVATAEGVVEDALSLCDGVQFSAWILVFVASGGEVHGNAFVFDRFNHRTVRFEPRGWRVTYNAASLDSVLKEYSRRVFDAEYIPPYQLQAAAGPQHLEVVEANGKRSRLPANGPCVIWSLIFIALMLEFPDLEPVDVARRLDSSTVSPRMLAQAVGHFIAAYKPRVPQCK